ncbi:GIY-YIG nuclease family protein [Planosporangium mesophilum]|uniref:GIY-YIG domain-containing protein n=1 Tax=Planosporangium mesophilum TaxID=689768 RepID=A0A8J3TGG5_9ACTN|nr:GIY-YIG nuclease family protein [Planosporangium mesophilum]NJC85141.1 GIY-YIG nuclease family protein [Planosporangium mesophilum]GII24284.1 hypothetical protein Pme01_38810 [Planosporangium mesophilum]
MPKISAALRDLATRPHALYRFWDRTDVLLYVGITADLPQRMGDHRTDKPWWSQVARVTVEHFDTREAALKAETESIREERPLYNVQGNILVHAPSNEGVEDAVRNQVDLILRHMCVHQDEYDKALSDATDAIDEAKNEPDDGLADADPTLLAAELKADSLTTSIFYLERAWEHLSEWLPDGQYERCRALAEEYERQWNLEIGEAELRDRTAWFIALEYGREYLAKMPPEERDEWFEVARGFLAEHVDDDHLTFHAAHYARAYKANRWYGRAYQMCSGSGRHNAACRNKAAFKVWYRDDPACSPGPCVGHSELCQSHLRAVLEGHYTWPQTGSPVVVNRYEPVPEDTPPF